MAVVMRSYDVRDQRDCLALFDGNCPEYFDPVERTDYMEFLDERPAGYAVCLQGQGVERGDRCPPNLALRCRTVH
jgi:hypothetical protein